MILKSTIPAEGGIHRNTYVLSDSHTDSVNYGHSKESGYDPESTRSGIKDNTVLRSNISLTNWRIS